MSNGISLFIATPATVMAELERYMAEEIDEISFPNALAEDWQTDFWQVDLADLYDQASARLTPQENALLAVLSGSDADASQDDALGINLMLTAEEIAERFPALIGAQGLPLARKLHTPSEMWPDAQALAGFLQQWLDALTKAATEKSGIVWVVWV